VCTDATKVLKLYRKPTDDQRRKLEAMLKAVPDDPQRAKRNHVSICWPEEIVYASDGSLAGFLMPRLDTKTCRPAALFWNPEDRAQYFPAFSWKYLCVAAANAASVVDLIHQKGHAVGDLNEENLLVNDRALVTLVDCDSMQVRDPGSGALFRCTVSREAYTAPEALSKDLSAIDRNFAQDYWALSVLVFQMLMEGQHPANGIGDPEERAERIKRGIFPFLGAPGFGMPQYAVPFSIVPDGLQCLFHRCFKDGHAHPELRPTAAEWRNELLRAAGTLIHCSEVEVHWYSPHLSGCPWCQEKRMVGLDRFQTELPPTPFKAPPPPPDNQSALVPPPQHSSSGWGALIAIAVALFIIILIVVGINNANERQRAEAARIEAQRQEEARQEAERQAERRRIEEERQRAEAERLRQAQEQLEILQASQNSDALDEIIRQRAALLGPNVIRVAVHNQCSDGGRIILAATFQLPDGSDRWVTEGWWEIKPNERIQLDAVTTNRNFYFYGHSDDGKQWTGDGDSQAIDAEVVDNKFGYVRGGPALGKNKRSVKMLHKLYEVGGNTLTLVCNK
jgi:hypothetical protein